MDFEWGTDIDNSFSEDRLDRSGLASFLTTHLVAEGTKRNYVLNINAEWGAGKTYFLKRWQHSIQNSHPVVYIDAWQQDYSDDPLLTVVSSIISQLQDQHGSPGDVTIHKAARGLLGFFKIAAPFVAKAVVKKVSGIEFDELADELKKECAFDMAASEVAGKVVDGLLKDHASKKMAIDGFKKAIKKWAAEIESTTKRKPPVFIFIDELDRCRPTYAIEMLEVIKHLFDMKGVVFVIATDTQQPQHAIKVIYGAGFDASTYLGRFFNRRITLKCGAIRDYVQNLPQFESLKTLAIDQEGFWPCKLELADLLEQLCVPMECYGLDLRTTDRIVDRLVAILDHTKEKSLQIDILFLMTLLCINEKDHSFYEKIVNKSVDITSGGLAAVWHRHCENSHSKKPIGLEIKNHANIPLRDQRGVLVKKKVIFIEYLQQRLEQLQSPAPYIRLLDQEFSNSDGEAMTESFILRASLIKNNGIRKLATWSNYTNWVELANSFDE